MIPLLGEEIRYKNKSKIKIQFQHLHPTLKEINQVKCQRKAHMHHLMRIQSNQHRET